MLVATVPSHNLQHCETNHLTHNHGNNALRTAKMILLLTSHFAFFLSGKSLISLVLSLFSPSRLEKNFSY